MSSTRGLIWPIVLIALGAALLAANFGYLPRFDAARLFLVLWPLLLVFIGLDLALARRAPAAALALQVAALLVALGLVATQPDGARFAGRGEGQSSVTVARDGTKAATLRVSVGGGRFTLVGGATELVEFWSDDPDLRPRITRRAGETEVRVEQAFIGVRLPFGGQATSIEARVASDVPFSIRLESGAGEFLVDLREVRVADVRIQTGASSLTVRLPKPAGEVKVDIESGASSITIEVPPGVEAKVSAEGGLLSVSGRTETAGYATSADRVTVSIRAGASSVAIR